MSNFIKQNVTYHLIDEGSVGQKIDNFLIKHLKSIPKSHIYKLLRSGQVRVNKKRVKTDFKLSQGDKVRIPPVNLQPTKPKSPLLISKDLSNIILKNILYEDDYVLVINKPSGIAVHGGSGLNFGVIELIRALRPKYRFLELIHRIDKETSGILLIAKKRSALVNVHQQMREKRVHKKYQVAVNGLWTDKQKIVDLELLKTTAADGQKMIRVLEGNYKNVLSKDSRSVFFLKKNFGKYSLLDVKLITGRTHQIRVHLAHLGFPVIGDQKYGDFILNKLLQKKGLKRMFLHAYEYRFIHPGTQEEIVFKAPLPEELKNFIFINEK